LGLEGWWFVVRWGYLNHATVNLIAGAAGYTSYSIGAIKEGAITIVVPESCLYTSKIITKSIAALFTSVNIIRTSKADPES